MVEHLTLTQAVAGSIPASQPLAKRMTKREADTDAGGFDALLTKLYRLSEKGEEEK